MFRFVICLTGAAALLCAFALPAAEVREAGSLDDFVILEYVAAGAYAPSALIAMDNNARILFECRDGCNPEGLRSAGIGFSDSQLEFLVATNLLVRDTFGDLYSTFPVLDAERTEALRAEVSELADTIAVAVEPRAGELARSLEAAGHGSQAYSVFFSYVLDGMAWRFFEEYSRIPPRALSARRPFWAGEVWAIQPARSSWATTRSIAEGGVTLKTTLPPRSELGAALFADRRRLKRALAQFSTPGRPVPESERELLSRFGLLGEAGRWEVLVIDEVEKDPVFRAAERLTSDLVDEFLEIVALDPLRERYRFSTPQQALVIVYHELMWELMDRFETLGLVTPPDILTARDAENLEEPSLRNSAVLIDRRLPKPNRQDVPEPKRDAVEEPQTGGGA